MNNEITNVKCKVCYMENNLLAKPGYKTIELDLPEDNKLKSIDQLFPKLRVGGKLNDEERIERMQVVLQTLSEGNTIKTSYEKVNLDPSLHDYWCNAYPVYQEAVHVAIEQGIQALEQSAIERGANGVSKDVYYKGEVVGSERVYSDSLLQFMLKAKRPEVYRESRNAEVNVNVKHSVETVPQSIWTEFERLDGMKRVGTGEVITVKPDSGLVDNGTSGEGDT